MKQDYDFHDRYERKKILKQKIEPEAGFGLYYKKDNAHYNHH